MTQVPELNRATVRTREHYRCARCGAPAPNGHWHHRRSRRVVDGHRHCVCNGIWLCSTCHQWCHANPIFAKTDGFVVSQWEATPGEVPVVTRWGLRWQNCAGEVRFE